MKSKYKAIVKYLINNKITKWKTLGCYTSNYECRKIILGEINSRRNTRRTVYAYKILDTNDELLEYWEDVFNKQRS